MRQSLTVHFLLMFLTLWSSIGQGACLECCTHESENIVVVESADECGDHACLACGGHKHEAEESGRAFGATQGRVISTGSAVVDLAKPISPRSVRSRRDLFIPPDHFVLFELRTVVIVV